MSLFTLKILKGIFGYLWNYIIVMSKYVGVVMNRLMSTSFDDLFLAAIEEPSNRFLFYKKLIELELYAIGTVEDDETLNL